MNETINAMPILKRLKSPDWSTLILELVLIFVGITAALWFDGAKERRAERELETAILGELVSALVSDTADLNMNLRSTENALTSIDTILARFDAGVPEDSAIATHFSTAAIITNFLQHVGTYEYLKSVGLGVVQNDGLRADISRYYEYEVQYLTDVEGDIVNEHWGSAVKPQMLEKFTYRLFFGPATPHDYAALATDREFRSVLTTTRSIQGWKANLTRAVLSSAESLLDSVKQDLARR